MRRLKELCADPQALARTARIAFREHTKRPSWLFAIQIKVECEDRLEMQRGNNFRKSIKAEWGEWTHEAICELHDRTKKLKIMYLHRVKIGSIGIGSKGDEDLYKKGKALGPNKELMNWAAPKIATKALDESRSVFMSLLVSSAKVVWRKMKFPVKWKQNLTVSHFYFRCQSLTLYGVWGCKRQKAV